MLVSFGYLVSWTLHAQGRPRYTRGYYKLSGPRVFPLGSHDNAPLPRAIVANPFGQCLEKLEERRNQVVELDIPQTIADLRLLLIIDVQNKIG